MCYWVPQSWEEGRLLSFQFFSYTGASKNSPTCLSPWNGGVMENFRCFDDRRMALANFYLLRETFMSILMSICLCGNRKTANVYVPPSLHFWHLIFLVTTTRVIVLNKIYLICSMHVYITFRFYLFVVVAGLCHKISIATTWH